MILSGYANSAYVIEALKYADEIRAAVLNKLHTIYTILRQTTGPTFSHVSQPDSGERDARSEVHFSYTQQRRRRRRAWRARLPLQKGRGPRSDSMRRCLYGRAYVNGATTTMMVCVRACEGWRTVSPSERWASSMKMMGSMCRSSEGYFRWCCCRASWHGSGHIFGWYLNMLLTIAQLQSCSLIHNS